MEASKHPASTNRTKGTDVTSMVAPCPAEPARMRLGFAGAGRIGFALGRHAADHGMHVSGYFSAHAQSARDAAHFTSSNAYSSLVELCRACDVVFLTPPDDALAGLVRDLATCGEPLSGTIVAHCSGSLPARVLEPARAAGAAVASAHPLAAVSERASASDALDGAFFTLEGDACATRALAQLLDACGNPHRTIAADAKTAYHAAAVFLSNLVVGLADEGYRLLERCGFTRAEAQAATTSLLEGNVRSVVERGCAAALTGPVARGDAGTVARHLAVLDGRERRIYAELSLVLADIARDAHPDRNDAALRGMLETAAAGTAPAAPTTRIPTAPSTLQEKEGIR